MGSGTLPGDLSDWEVTRTLYLDFSEHARLIRFPPPYLCQIAPDLSTQARNLLHLPDAAASAGRGLYSLVRHTRFTCASRSAARFSFSRMSSFSVFSCPTERPAPCSTRRERFAISVLSCALSAEFSSIAAVDLGRLFQNSPTRRGEGVEVFFQETYLKCSCNLLQKCKCPRKMLTLAGRTALGMQVQP